MMNDIETQEPPVWPEQKPVKTWSEKYHIDLDGFLAEQSDYIASLRSGTISAEKVTPETVTHTIAGLRRPRLVDIAMQLCVPMSRVKPILDNLVDSGVVHRSQTTHPYYSVE